MASILFLWGLAPTTSQQACWQHRLSCAHREREHKDGEHARAIVARMPPQVRQLPFGVVRQLQRALAQCGRRHEQLPQQRARVYCHAPVRVEAVYAAHQDRVRAAHGNGRV